MVISQANKELGSRIKESCCIIYTNTIELFKELFAIIVNVLLILYCIVCMLYNTIDNYYKGREARERKKIEKKLLKEYKKKGFKI